MAKFINKMQFSVQFYIFGFFGQETFGTGHMNNYLSGTEKTAFKV